MSKFKRIRFKQFIMVIIIAALIIVTVCSVIQNKKYASEIKGIQVRIAKNHSTYEETNGDVNWYIESWKNSLKQMNMDTDIVFLGDSITFGNDFQSFFSDKSIVNMGIPGDGIGEITARADMIADVNPDKIFIMIGINGLKAESIQYCDEKYREMLDTIIDKCPNSKIYLQSVLPVSIEQELAYTDNETIVKFNKKIEEISKSYQCKYINVHDIYFDGRQLNEDATYDGIHLRPEFYKEWMDLIRIYIYE